MLTKNAIKYISSLRIKKYRNEHNSFIAEGEKLVDELLSSYYTIKTIYHTSDWKTSGKLDCELFLVNDAEMKKISGLTTFSKVLAVVEIPSVKVDFQTLNNSLSIALDGVQDPGNLGTIIRLADWFGIDSILCSDNTVDAFSPKVIQSCMGAIADISISYTNLPETLKKVECPIYGTFMEGDNIYSSNLESKGIIVMGNEGNGISKEVEKLVTNKIHIPHFAYNRNTVESLNVAMATAIVCSEFRRRWN